MTDEDALVEKLARVLVEAREALHFHYVDGMASRKMPCCYNWHGPSAIKPSPRSVSLPPK